MTPAFKRRVIAVAVLAVAVWPPLHHGLARHYDFDPWRFFGWAMYSTPNPTVEVGLAQPSARGMQPIPIGPELQELLSDYAHRRSIWGDLLPPHGLARSVREIIGPRPLAIRVRRFRIDPATAMVVPRDDFFGYDADGSLVRSESQD